MNMTDETTIKTLHQISSRIGWLIFLTLMNGCNTGSDQTTHELLRQIIELLSN